ncbi:hypothetical protein [Spirosoma validum]|uniref:Uncharacterized protein n=1 Tax=Spirosoma validum TaxID=2771355 RepID=A0A927B1R0_9BACT|nr:hypothetical protein [Spirosoma validum]MBD2753723.1 hypothetical protein [Spirosoma validum]
MSEANWRDLYETCQFMEDELTQILDDLESGQRHLDDEAERLPRSLAIRDLLGLTQPIEIVTVCPKCLARERKKVNPVDTAQTALF